MIERNRALLLRAVLSLFMLAGLAPGGKPIASLRHGLRLTLLRLVRPAEAAARRLIYVRALGMQRPEPPARRASAPCGESGSGTGARAAIPGLVLSDPRLPGKAAGRRMAPGPGPRMGVIGVDDHLFADPPEPTPVDSTRLCQRLLALHRALEDLSGHAERLLRRAARVQAASKASPIAVARATMPMRPGRPPGHRQVPQHEIDELLQECHALSLFARARRSPT